MLAYVFWHWAHSGHADDEYERALRAFQAALKQAAPAGFLGSAIFKVAGPAPWLGGAPAYADWYLVNGSAALDPLNVAAVSGACEEPHARVAQAMAAGAGSLFTLRSGPTNVSHARHATFATKPRSMSYDTFYAEIAALRAIEQASLWRRQMVLGPTPEFVLLTPEPLLLPAAFQPLSVALTPI